MTDFVLNLLKKFKKPTPQDSTVTIKPNSKNLVSSDSVLLNEHVKVNVYSLKEVNIDKDGVITGNIHSKSCVVNGHVKGNILSADYIEVKNTAVIEGNIKSGSIQIEAGSMINGFISIEKKIKLPSIEITEPGTVKSGDVQLPQEGYVTVVTSPVNAEIPELSSKPVAELEITNARILPTETKQELPEIKPEPVISPPLVTERVWESAKLERQEIQAPGIPKKQTEIAGNETKEQKTENIPKKPEAPSSNDSWW